MACAAWLYQPILWKLSLIQNGRQKVFCFEDEIMFLYLFPPKKQKVLWIHLELKGIVFHAGRPL